MTTIEQLTGGTHAVIDLDAYAANIAALRKLVDAETALMAVVKADAYGHGALCCARHAVRHGAAWLGVARIQEGVRLRIAGETAPILVLGPPDLRELDVAREHNIAIAIGATAAADAAIAGADRDRPLRVHVKLDTGMRRYGVTPDQAPAISERLLRTPGIELEGVFTHFACADAADQSTTDRQLERFLDTVEALRAIWQPRWVHAANSAGVLRGRVDGTNLVRCGIATFGLSPSRDVAVDERFSPVMSLHTVIGRAFTLEPGEGVSYGHTYHATTREHLATAPVGYGDGLPRRLSNCGWLGWNGERCPIRGRVCMDQTIISVPPDAREGDRLTVMGAGPGSMTTDDIATLCDTINYEVVTRLSARVPRIYLAGGRPVAWEHVVRAAHGSCSG